MKKLFALLALAVLSTPSFALQYCALDVLTFDAATQKNEWHQVEKANRGDDFGDRTVGKWDDGDTCRSQGRKIGPDYCVSEGAVQYRIRAMKNSGTEKTWYEQC